MSEVAEEFGACTATSDLIRKNEPFTCLVCARTFQDRQILQNHKEKDHSISVQSQASVG